MRVLMKRSVAVRRAVHTIGREADLPDALGEALVRAGHAKRIDRAPAKPEGDAPKPAPRAPGTTPKRRKG